MASPDNELPLFRGADGGSGFPSCCFEGILCLLQRTFAPPGIPVTGSLISASFIVSRVQAMQGSSLPVPSVF